MKRKEGICFSALLLAAAVTYLWNLPLNGWGNAYYAAAAQAGATDWKAFFYGSLDAGNGITVDKLPGSIWVNSLSARIFGTNSWSLLAPQALLGTGAVALVYLTVRQSFSALAALTAGVVLLLTPAAAVIFRYNNPDALLTFLLTLATYLAVRALTDGRWRWVLFLGVVVGAGFLTKSAQALLLTPVLASVYLYAGPGRVQNRLVQLGGSLLTAIATAGWWVLIAESTPTEHRPYAGGSFNNSFVEVLSRQNGLGRVFGTSGGGTAGDGSTDTGPLRLLLYASFGTQGAWLIPAALIILTGSLILLRYRPRNDARRATLLLAGGWLLVYASTFSFMGGVVHPYYLSTLAPAIAMLIGTGLQIVWPARRWLGIRLALAVSVLSTALLAFGYLATASGPGPALSIVVLALCLISCELLVFRIRKPWVVRTTSATALLGCVTGPLAFTLSAVLLPHTGVTPAAALPGTSVLVDSPTSTQFADQQDLTIKGSALGHPADARVVERLVKNGKGYRWAAATPGGLNAANYQLAAGMPVLPLGGFNGGSPYPTLAQFQTYIETGQIRYLISRHDSQDIEAEADFADSVLEWVRDTYVPDRVGDLDIFDLAALSP